MSCKYCHQAEDSCNKEIKTATSFFEIGDYKTAFDIALPLAESGNVAAQCMIGSFLAVGLGVEVDDLTAEKWLLEAGRKGCGLAWNNLSALCLIGGKALTPNINTAIECRNKAIENGFDLVRDI